MQDEKVIGTSASDSNGIPLLDVVRRGSFIEKRYIKCPHIEKKCKWLLAGKHSRHSFLDDACYLSGSFTLDCPE